LERRRLGGWCAGHGPQWLTGGPLGVEASWLVFPLIAIFFVAVRSTRYYFSVQKQGGMV
jgi:hypothetical protein